MDDVTRLSRCSRCGRELPLDAAEGLCPACLMAAAMEFPASGLASDDATVLSGTLPSIRGTEPQISIGQQFGPYRIDRLLGRGGMGEVYEAEHLEHGRRLALKVLGRRLAGPDDRARFLREGQLAASISHPHTVYIFGSEEIGGTPVISMELVAGGTLKDRVERDGPLKPSAAVDAILDVIAGLDAAQAGGILHRDIKPSNCFVDPDGRVKVGDFGLSISTLARDVSQRAELGGFQGTPQYAAPEQLKGQPLDLRADIYAVGATLHYLLTGHAPFEDNDLMTLVTRVTTEPPVSPRVGRRAVPRGLSEIVLGCLAKNRADRPASYAALEDALRPFSSVAPTPATLGLRAVAGAIDWLLLAALTVPITLEPVLKFTPPASVDFSVSYSGATERDTAVPDKVLVCLITFLYYALLEGFGDASLGKRLCGLRVTHEGRRPGPVRAVVRTAVFMAPMLWPIFGPELLSEPPGGKPDTRFVIQIAASVVLGLAVAWIGFTSMRRRNGYAAWHDLASGTRVVLERHTETRATFETPAEVTTRPRFVQRRIGPFDVVGPLGTTGSGELVAGFDPVLRRRVWLHVLPIGAPSIPAERRDAGRPGRLHWLAGHRSPDEAWDAYEAPDGAALSVITGQRQPWRTVRHWLVDLARELEAAERDGTLPVLAIDRVWITRASRAVLLEFPAPGVQPSGNALDLSPQRFLAAVGATALDGDPIPLSARETLDALERDNLADAASRRLLPLASRADRVTSWRRGVSIALANVPLIAVIIAVAAFVPLMTRVLRHDFLLPINCLVEINKIDAQTDDASVRLRSALETYCSARYGHLYADAGFWSDPRADQVTGPLQPLAKRVVERHPAVSPADADAAEAATRATLDERSAKEGAATGLAIAIALPSTALLFCAALAILSSLIVRGGIMVRLLGLAIVDRRGLRVSRLRGLGRALIAWSPALVLGAHFGVARLLRQSFEETFLAIWLVLLTMGVAVAGTLWTIAHPTRGWHDRFARTWVVPR
jgi:serine/threonine protein kinase